MLRIIRKERRRSVAIPDAFAILDEAGTEVGVAYSPIVAIRTADGLRKATGQPHTIRPARLTVIESHDTPEFTNPKDAA